MNRIFVVCLNESDMFDWRYENHVSLLDRSVISCITSRDDTIHKLRGYLITADDKIERYRDYHTGRYWHEVEDQLALCAHGVDTGDPRRQTPSN